MDQLKAHLVTALMLIVRANLSELEAAARADLYAKLGLEPPDPTPAPKKNRAHRRARKARPTAQIAPEAAETAKKPRAAKVARRGMVAALAEGRAPDPRAWSKRMTSEVEEATPAKRRCSTCRQPGHRATTCPGMVEVDHGEYQPKPAVDLGPSKLKPKTIGRPKSGTKWDAETMRRCGFPLCGGIVRPGQETTHMLEVHSRVIRPSEVEQWFSIPADVRDREAA